VNTEWSGKPPIDPYAPLRKGMRGVLAAERLAERVHDDERPLNDSPADSAPAISRAVAAARPSRQKIGGPARAPVAWPRDR
jgi:hypothetical protein